MLLLKTETASPNLMIQACRQFTAWNCRLTNLQQLFANTSNFFLRRVVAVHLFPTCLGGTAQRAVVNRYVGRLAHSLAETIRVWKPLLLGFHFRHVQDRVKFVFYRDRFKQHGNPVDFANLYGRRGRFIFREVPVKVPDEIRDDTCGKAHHGGDQVKT
jgi:hypothetical protein